MVHAGMSGLPPLPPPHILAAQRAASLAAASGGLMPKASTTDYTRYFKRFGSSLECGSFYCKDMNYREHFHCTVPMCKDKVSCIKVCQGAISERKLSSLNQLLNYVNAYKPLSSVYLCNVLYSIFLPTRRCSLKRKR